MCDRQKQIAFLKSTKKYVDKEKQDNKKENK